MRDSRRTTAIILAAAQRVIVQSGVEKTTIEEVAREAGVSKGGVLHHFPSKDAIIVGLVDMLVAQFETDMAERQALDPEPNGAFTRAFLGAVTDTDNHRVEVCFALQAAFRDVPQLEKALGEANLRWQSRIERDGIDPVCASTVRLAADGLWLARMHRATVPSTPLRKSLMEYLLTLTHTAVAVHAEGVC
jgi:AcrR family transcriptional regulator